MFTTNDKFRYIHTSLTRISNFSQGFDLCPVDRSEWKNGDYVACEVKKIGGSTVKAELPNGRMMELMKGDTIVGALGVRYATLEVTGSYEYVGEEGLMQILTGAGLLGQMTSHSMFITSLIDVQYLGHIFQGGEKKNMADFVPDIPLIPFEIPTILFVGASMSSGKTTSARIVARQLKRMGLKVTGAKLTGAGRYRDILSIKDAGADHVFDFVDVGLPSSICSEEKYKQALQKLLSMIAGSRPDVAVIEIGASPLEPYNGRLAIEAIKKHVKATILCASDPYAVLGVMEGFHLKPSLVSGPTANTLAGIELTKNLCQVEAMNLIDQENMPALRLLLKEKLGIS